MLVDWEDEEDVDWPDVVAVLKVVVVDWAVVEGVDDWVVGAVDEADVVIEEEDEEEELWVVVVEEIVVGDSVEELSCVYEALNMTNKIKARWTGLKYFSCILFKFLLSLEMLV